MVRSTFNDMLCRFSGLRKSALPEIPFLELVCYPFSGSIDISGSNLQYLQL